MESTRFSISILLLLDIVTSDLANPSMTELDAYKAYSSSAYHLEK